MLKWSEITAPSCSSFHALFEGKLNEGLSIKAEDQEVLSEVHFTPEILCEPPNQIFHKISTSCCTSPALSAIPTVAEAICEALVKQHPRVCHPQGSWLWGPASRHLLPCCTREPLPFPELSHLLSHCSSSSGKFLFV